MYWHMQYTCGSKNICMHASKSKLFTPVAKLSCDFLLRFAKIAKLKRLVINLCFYIIIICIVCVIHVYVCVGVYRLPL